MTRNWLALGVLTLAVLLIGVDGTVLALATPFISRDLGATATQILWIGDIYSFVLAALLVSMGSLGDRIGHKKLLLCGATVFGLVSAVTAYAPTAETLIGMRALLGVAGATLMPATLALIRGLFPQPRERSIAIGIWAAAFSAGAAFGPVLGGLLLEHFWWGSVFLINVPVMAVLLVAGIVLLPEHRNPEPGPWDLPSVGLSMIGMLGIVYGDQGGSDARPPHGHRRRGDSRRRRADAVRPAAAEAAQSAHRGATVRQPGILWRGGRQPVVGPRPVRPRLLPVPVLPARQGYSPLKAGLAELPAAIAATVFGVLAGFAVRFWSQRAVLTSAAGPRRHRDGVADHHQPVHRLPAAGGGPVRSRRRSGPGVHRRQ